MDQCHAAVGKKNAVGYQEADSKTGHVYFPEHTELPAVRTEGAKGKEDTKGKETLKPVVLFQAKQKAVNPTTMQVDIQPYTA